MSKFIGIIIGAVAITVGILIDIGTFGLLTPVLIAVAGALLTAGAGLVLSGIGTLISGSAGTSPGIAWATRNPIAPWGVTYGRAVVGGIVVFINEFGDSDKYLDMVIILASHACQSVDSLLFDKQLVQLSTAGGAFTGIGDSFSPVQQTVNITHITRANNVVTVTLAANIPLLQPGDKVIIGGALTGDYTLQGRWPVEQIVSRTVGSPGTIVFTYISGGLPSIVDNEGTCTTTWADYGKKIHMEVMLGTQALGTTFPGMLAGTASDGDTGNLVQNTSNPWTANCSLVGKTAVFLRLHYDATVFSGGLPAISFMIHGKNDIYDPRLGTFGAGGTTAYTENAALCIADYLHNSTWGFKALYGTEIPTTPLIAQANICDEDQPLAVGGGTPYVTGTVSATNGSTAVVGTGTAWVSGMVGGVIVIEGFPCTIQAVADATHLTLLEEFGGVTGSVLVYSMMYNGGTEPRYTCNGSFDLGTGRGAILQNLLTSCGGRLTYAGGQFGIWAAVWYGSSPAPEPGVGSMTALLVWKPTVSVRDLYNGVKGTYICPANNWHPADIPPYAQDATHGYNGPAGYSGDSNLAADGGDRRWLDMQLPFTISTPTAQRLCKIELLRRRQQGTGTFRYNMVGYQFTVMDVISMTLPLFGWTDKTLEILAHRFIVDKQQQAKGEDLSVLGTEIDVQETDASVYDWSASEELTPEGYQQPFLPNPFTPAPPTNLVLESDDSTVIVSLGALADSILVSWDAPLDGYVTEGGHIEVQYQEVLLESAGTVSATNGLTAIVGVGTAFDALMEGGTVTINGVTQAIGAVTDATHLALVAAFTGPTAATQPFTIAYSTAWVGLPSVNPSVTAISITGVVDGTTYNVQIRSVNGGGAPSAWVPASVIAAGIKEPIAYRPYAETYLFAPAEYGPSLVQVTGSGGQSIEVYGTRPVSVLSQAVAAPVIDDYAVISPHTGSALYFGPKIAQVFPIDAEGLYGPGSNFTAFTISAINQRVTFGVTFAAGTVGYEVFLGKDRDWMIGQGAQSVGSPMASSIILDYGYVGGYGQPDLSAVAIHARAKRVIHAGILDAGVASSTLSTVVIGVPSAPTLNQFAGRFLIVIGKAGLPETQPLSVMEVVSNDVGSPYCTLTVVSPLGSAVGTGDLVVICFLSSAATANSITDSGIPNPYAPAGLAPDAEIGNLVRVMFDPTYAAAVGSTVKITGNTGTVISNTTWPVIPGNGTLFIVEETGWRCDVISVAAPNQIAPTIPSPAPQPLISIPSAPLAGYVALVEIMVQDAYGNDSPDNGDGLRMMYVVPTPNVMAMSVDGTVAIGADLAPRITSINATGVSALVKIAPSGADLTFDISFYSGGTWTIWLTLTIPNGTTGVTATSAQLTAAPTVPTGSPLRLDITATGTVFPGSDLSVIIYY